MGARGPVPKRSDQRLGHRAKAEAEKITAAPAAAVVKAPDPDPLWHPLARDWFVSLAESGQSRFYEASDWQTARVWAEVLSRQLSADKLSAVMVQAWAGSAGELLTTEGARRRAQLELQRGGQSDEDEDASVTALDRYRAQVS